MPLQDLTPQLRTRLSRLERVVGWFVVIATLLLLVGLGYYVYQLAERKGWFLTKVPYFTFVRNATGLRIGDRVRLMGFDAGEIVQIEAQPPDDEYFNVYIQFEVRHPYYGYLWTDSRAKVGSADFLGNRFIEVTKGTNGAATYALREISEVPVSQAFAFIGGTNYYVFAENILDPAGTNFVIRNSDGITREKLQFLLANKIQRIQVMNKSSPEINPPKWIWDGEAGRYKPVPEKNKGYWVLSDESPALTERLENVVNTVERALPDFLELTNKLLAVLTRADSIVSNTDAILINAQPMVTNLAQFTAQLNSGKGALGEMLLPTNVNAQLTATLSNAGTTLQTVETNLSALSGQLLLTLINLANTTSNLHTQVEANTNLVSSISQAIIHSDEFIQGLKRHWLLRSAFKKPKEKKEEPADTPKPRLRPGR
jgi:ABC-type transporter Mla subunit MlaD